MWIAREKDGSLMFFNLRPHRSGGYFNHKRDDFQGWMLDEDLFPEVTWENSPQKVEIKLK